MKILFVTSILLLIIIGSVHSQEINNRIYFYGGFQGSEGKIEKSNPNYEKTSTQKTLNGSIGIGYEYYFSKRSGIELYSGYSNFSRSYLYDVEQSVEDTLSEMNLNWNNIIHIPNDQHFISLRVSYVYHQVFKERNKLSLILGGHLRYGVFKETMNSSNLFYESEEGFSEAIGPRSHVSFTNYRQITVNPYFSLRYERMTKYNNTYGASINFNIPLMKIYEGDMNILPDTQDLTSSFEYYSRGGFLGLSLFYSIGFQSKV